MLFRSGKNWALDFFLRHGWFLKRRFKVRPRSTSWGLGSTIPAECLENRILLSTITVTSLSDSLNAGSGVTLRDAIQAANTDTSVDGSIAGEAGVQNAIVFQTGLTGTIFLNAGLGQMAISSSMTIAGLGAANTIIDAQHNSRIVDISAGAENVMLKGMTITGGETSSDNSYGAGILTNSTGTLTVANTAVTGNLTTGFLGRGAGIFTNSGPVQIVNSTISGNATTGQGGDGAAVFSLNAPVALTNCTLAGNSTAGYHADGAAVYSVYAGASITLTNCTVSANFNNGANANGSAVNAVRGSITLSNSIVSGNTITTGTSPDVGFGNYSHQGTFVARNSLIGVNSGTPLAPTAGSPDANGNLVGTFASPLDAGLGPLANNGGQTQTLALLAGSPAINAGSDALAVDPTAENAPLTDDQRGAGFPRFVGTVDIGAFEFFQLLTDTTPTASLPAVAGVSTGNVVLATFTDAIPAAGRFTEISVPGATATSTVGGFPAVGNYMDAGGVEHGFVYDGTTYVTLDPSGSIGTNVTGSSGNIVAGYYLDTGHVYHGFMYDGTKFTVVDPPGSVFTGVGGPFSGDEISGDYQDSSGVLRGFIYNFASATYTIFAVPGITTTNAWAGVSNGEVAGFYNDANNATHGFLYNGTTVVTLDPPGSTATIPTGISGNTVAGYYSDANNVQHGFIYNGTTFTTVDPPGSVYTGIGGPISGHRVSGDYQDSSGVQRGFVYDIATSTYTIFTIPGTDATYAWGGISGGSVGGFYYDSSGKQQGFEYQLPPLPDDFNASVDWGGAVIGTPTVSVQLVSQGNSSSDWEVVGNVTYAEPGNYTPMVTVSDASDNTLETDKTQFNVVSSNSSPPATVSFAGEYAVATAGSNTLTLASIGQNVDLLTLAGSVTATAAIVVNPAQLLANGEVVATYQNNTIVFTTGAFAGQTWTKLDLPANYTNQSGAATHVIQNGTSLTFVNKLGGMSPGNWVSPTQLFATAWNETVTIGIGKLLWQDGSIWNESLVVTGADNGSGTTTIAAAPSQINVFDYKNASGKGVHLVQTGTNNVVFVFASGQMATGTFISATQLTTPLFPNDVATISNDLTTITWQDGSVWTKTAPTTAITVTDYTNAHGVAVHLVQNGTNQLAFVDSRGRTTLGTMLTPITAVSDLYGPGDVATMSGNTVAWQDGSVWTRTITVFDYVNSSGKAVHVVQAGPNNVVFIFASGQMSVGTFINATQATTPQFPGDVATSSNNMATVTWTDGGVWTQTAPTTAITATTYTNPNGALVHLIQNGTNQVAFIDGRGRISLGTMLTANTAVSDLYGPGDVATISGSTVVWQDGTVWTQTGAVPLTTTFIDTNGAVSHVRLTSSTTLIGLDGELSGLTATRVNGALFWSNGAVWDNFDLNALNALFQMATGYP